MWYTHTIGYQSIFKRKDILTYAKTSMKLKDLMLSEMSLTKRQMIPLRCSTDISTTET